MTATASLPDLAAPARIAVLSGYMTYYEPHMPAGFRAERTRWAEGIADLLSGEGEARFFGLLTDDETGRRIAGELAAWRPDVVVLAPAMPGPAGFTWAALVDLPRVPVVIWAAGHLDALPPSYDSVDHLANSGQVGVAMIGNVLARHGRRPAVVTGRWYDHDTQAAARRAVRAAASAGRVAGARVGVLGQPLDGYINVTVDAGILAGGLGAELVEIPLAEWEETFAGVDDAAIAAVAGALTAAHSVSAPEGEDFRASCRLAAALQQVARRHRLDCGTFNSHLDFGHRNPKIGLVGGLATSWLSSTGIPFTDTGDTITALAMLLGRRLSGGAVYTELNAIDYVADAILCANTGEADFAAAASPEEVWIFPARSFTGKAQKGCIVDSALATGPAAIVGLTPAAGARNGFRLIVLPGEVTGRPELDLKVPHSLFRPHRGGAPAAFSRWIEAGATHHAALCPGADPEQLAAAGRHLGIDVEIVA
ncbi:MAG: hypothetical protein RLO50_04825 [Azospirillaceae bacterium]